MPAPISSFLLRTTDAPGATAFYDAVLGHHGDAVYPLHENARARGARPHWIGRVATDDPETLGGRLLADGGERLGPLPGGGFILRDPGGALLGIGAEPTPSVAGVVFHVLRSRDADAAAARYTAACGWAFDPTGPAGYRTFAWSPGGPAVGALAGVEHEPHVHPHWLYFFGVASVDAAAATARARGATLLPLGELGGRRFVVGDDPQGAAFGLMER